MSLSRRFGGAGVRRRQFRRKPGVSDFRLAVEGAQASFRRTTEDASLDPYVTLVSGEINKLTDTIPQAYKSTSHVPYVVAAPSATQRPDPGSGLAIDFASATNDGLSTRGEGTDLGDLFNGLGSITVYAVGSAAGGAFQTYWSAGDTAGNTDNTRVLKNSSNVPEYHRVNANDGTNTTVYGSSIDTSSHIIASVYNGAESTLYVNAVSPVSVANVRDPNTLNVFAIGFLDRSSPIHYLNGSVHEIFLCLAAHDSATVEAVTSKLQTWYER